MSIDDPLASWGERHWCSAQGKSYLEPMQPTSTLRPNVQEIVQEGYIFCTLRCGSPRWIIGAHSKSWTTSLTISSPESAALAIVPPPYLQNFGCGQSFCIKLFGVVDIDLFIVYKNVPISKIKDHWIVFYCNIQFPRGVGRNVRAPKMLRGENNLGDVFQEILTKSKKFFWINLFSSVLIPNMLSC